MLDFLLAAKRIANMRMASRATTADFSPTAV